MSFSFHALFHFLTRCSLTMAAFTQPVLVLIHSALKVVCDADVEGAISLACKDVEVVLPHILDSRLRGNDRVGGMTELAQGQARD